MNKDRQLILASIESEYGTDAAPTTANAILGSEFSYSAVGRSLERAASLGHMGNKVKLVVGSGQRISFKTELRGSGTAGTAPQAGVLLRACRMTEVITTDTDVAYTPHSDDTEESITIYYYYDGRLHKMLGCRGTFSIDLKAGEFGVINFEFQGLYGGPVDEVFPGVTMDNIVPPRFVSAAFTVAGYVHDIENLKFDIVNSIVSAPSCNTATGTKDYRISGRAPTMSIDPEDTALADFNWWSKWDSSTLMSVSTSFGAAGNLITIDAPKFQVTKEPSYGDRDNVTTLNIDGELQPSAGDDELVMTFA